MLRKTWKGVKRRYHNVKLPINNLDRRAVKTMTAPSWLTPHRIHYQIWIDPEWVSLDTRTSAMVHQCLQAGASRVDIRHDRCLAAVPLEIRCRSPIEVSRDPIQLPVRRRRWWTNALQDDLVAVLPAAAPNTVARGFPSKESILLFFSRAPSLLIDAGSSTLSLSDDAHPRLHPIIQQPRLTSQKPVALSMDLESILV